MSQPRAENEPQQHSAGSGPVVDSLERIWNEIKEISRQVERETRRGGRVAKLRLDLRQLNRELVEVRARLGRAVYEAQKQAGGELRVDEVEGWAARIAAIDDLLGRIAAKQKEIEGLRDQGPRQEREATAAAS